MKCMLCGEENINSAQFCRSCGAVINPFESGAAPPTGEQLPMVKFTTAVQEGFRRYIDFSGRSTRAEYWWFALFLFIGSILAGLLDTIMGNDGGSSSGPLEGLFFLATLIPALAVGARRLHDVNRSGWWQLLILTFFGIILLIVWAVRQGDIGSNRHGVDPRQVHNLR